MTRHIHYRAHLQPGGVHIDQQEADTVMPRCIAVCACKHEHHIRTMRQRCPDLRTAQHELIAVYRSERLERCEVRARIWLRVTLAPLHPARGDIRQILSLLRLGAEVHQRRAKHPRAETVIARRTAIRHGLGEYQIHERRRILTAILTRPRHRQVTPLRQRPLHANVQLPALIC